MKQVLKIFSLTILLFFICGISQAAIKSVAASSFLATSDTVNLFYGWTEEQYKAYEDSVIAALYPPVEAHKMDSASWVALNSASTYQAVLVSEEAQSTIAASVDTQKSVGQIQIKSGISPNGAKTYQIPIDVYPGINGFQPKLSLDYSSHQGKSVIGTGWSLSGISMISRGTKSIHYDNTVDGVKMIADDAFYLNGIRLLKQEENSGIIIYESERGNIKARAYVSGNITKYFEVFYPEGHKGIFGIASNTANYLYYPMTSLSDLDGNTISYTYNYSNNSYNISRISYNGSSVEFIYEGNRLDPLLYYSGGIKVYEANLLKNINVNYEGKTIGTYSLTYINSNNKDVTLLSQVGYSSGEDSFNPLIFHYTPSSSSTLFKTSETRLYAWYTTHAQNSLKIARGRFDYDNGMEGLAVVPNYNPYWQHYRHSTDTRHSQNQFVNYYDGSEEIFLCLGLDKEYSQASHSLLTGTGFVDILCADLEGKQAEYVIKVNNVVADGMDQVTFHVYALNMKSGLGEIYTRTYSFPTVYTDADDNTSIQPKFYYVGDFNGDGKQEIMAISVHQPFGDTSKPSTCYIFDLVNDKIIYQQNLLEYDVTFLGTNQTDPDVAENNTDKLFVLDHDGDGKSDICHINDSGTHVYRFITSGTDIVSYLKTTTSGLTLSNLTDRTLIPLELNGDGKTDLLRAPQPTSSASVAYWTVYNSSGNGYYESQNFQLTNYILEDNSGIIVQDVNNDGISDLMQYYTYGFATALARNNKFIGFYTNSYHKEEATLIPVSSHSRNISTQLLCLKDSVITRYSSNFNYAKEAMITGMVNSTGLLEVNSYKNIDATADGEFYTKGGDATYPYVNLQEPMPVLASTETYDGEELLDCSSLSYCNAVIHRQGLGFCGFEKVITTDKRGDKLEQIYKPYEFSTLYKEVSPKFERTYSYSATVESDKTLKIRLGSWQEKDLLKNTTTTHLIDQDEYGYTTYESTYYPVSGAMNKTTKYVHNTTVGDGYSLGFMYDQVKKVHLNGETHSERMYIPTYHKRRPIIRYTYVNDSQVKRESFAYDSLGNIVTSTAQPYASSNILQSSYVYDTHGRLVKETDPLGLSKEYAYDSLGRVSSTKDIRGNATTHVYDSFGREVLTTFPDKTIESTTYEWIADSSSGLYSITESGTGKPSTKTTYDALNREIRISEMRFDGSTIKIDKVYDSYGRESKESLPYKGDSPSLWNTYTYDIYDRITAYKEASGRTSTYSYDGMSVTSIADGVVRTRTYNGMDNLVSVTDSAGTITFNLRPDGQPSSIVSPSDITTTFTYDNYGRQLTIDDPSHGVTSYEYDAAGNVAKETYATGKSIQYTYDTLNRLKTKITSEFTVTYTYGSKGELVCVSDNSGTTLKEYIYDSLGRLITDLETYNDFYSSYYLARNFSYMNGNVAKITYSSHKGDIGAEHFTYTNGHLSEVKWNNTTSIYKLIAENEFGKPTESYTTGGTRRYGYTQYGLPSFRLTENTQGDTIQYESYVFDPLTGNLQSKCDHIHNLANSYRYDCLNRLTSDGVVDIKYDNKGNILSKGYMGDYTYSNADKPYAVTDLAGFSTRYVANRGQSVEYNSFRRPSLISENGYEASIDYNGDYDRMKMLLTKDDAHLMAKYYFSGCYETEIDSLGNEKERLYLNGGYYDSPAVYIKDSSGVGLHYILRDYLGSIRYVTNSLGNVEQELSYDAWGRFRYPDDGRMYGVNVFPEPILGRGFTGHEHLTWCGLVNMNARLYDFGLGRFLSPDPFVQSPDLSQNYNRYAYAMNNPLRYTDESGEFWHIIIGAIIGGGFNVIYKAMSGQLHSWGDGFAAFGIGALAGAAGATVGVATFGLAGGGAAGAGGFFSGAASGAASSAVSMPIQSAGNSLYFEDPFITPEQYALGIAGGAVVGGTVNGVTASVKGKNFFTGSDKQPVQSPLNNVGGASEIKPTATEPPQSQSLIAEEAISTQTHTQSQTLLHYTAKDGYENIMSSQKLLPSSGSVHARYGDGQYLTDLNPSDYTAWQISRRLYGVPWNTQKLQYFIRIDVSGLNVVYNAPHNYLILGNTPLNIQNRIVESGVTIFKIKF